MGAESAWTVIDCIHGGVTLTNYLRICPKKCGGRGQGTQIFLINPKKGDKIICPECGIEYVVGMKPFLKQV